MSRYMLDTDISSYIMNRTCEAAIRRLQRTAIEDVCISAITRSEIEYGVEVSPRREKNQRALDAFLLYVEVLDYPGGAALDYAQIRAYLKARGQLIGANDLFIAAHARHLGLTLATNNIREFGRVPKLKVENWAGEAN